MKKPVGCVGMTILGGLALYGVWVMTPPSRYEAKFTEAVKRAAERETADQKTAKDPAVNAFLDPVFLPYWGRKDKEYVKDSEAQKKLERVGKYSDIRHGEDKKLEDLVKAKDAKMESDFREFAAFYPSVHKISHGAQFTTPLDGPADFKTLVPNYLSLRAIHQFSSAYAEYLVLTGKPDEALGVAEDGLRFGKLVGNSSVPLIGMMISLAIQSIGQQTLAMVFETSPKLASPESLAKITVALEQSIPPYSNFVNSLEEEAYATNNSAKKIATGEVMDGIANPGFPGMFQRELRIYKNIYTPMLEQVRNDQPVDISGAVFNVSQWFLGNNGLLASTVIPNFNRARKQFRVLEKRQAFLHLYASLARAAQAQKKWPASLQELKGYQPLGKLDLSRVQYKVDGKKMELSYTLLPEESVTSDFSPRAEMAKWEILTPDKWVLHGPAI